MTKKRLLPALLAVILVVLLSACGCKHESWTDADCVTPKTCGQCGETEGEPAGHDYLEADCVTPKKCSLCGETEGQPLGHDWLEAECLTPKTCAHCGLTEGEPAGHDWLDATTEEPRTCARCAVTEGERIMTDPRFTTAANEMLFGVWEGLLTVPADSLDMGLRHTDAMLEMTYRVEFFPDGTMTVKRVPVDDAEFVRAMVASEVEYVYLRFEYDGYTRKEADAAIRKTYDQTMEEYVAEQLGIVDVEALFRDRVEQYVYYLEDGNLYRAPDWSSRMTANACAVENGVLLLSLDGGEAAAFAPAEE